MPSCKILQLSMPLVLRSHSALLSVCQDRSVCKYPSIEKSDERLPPGIPMRQVKDGIRPDGRNTTEQWNKLCSPDAMSDGIKIIS